MDDGWRTSVWRQFGAAIDMLEDALRACPEPLWHAPLWTKPAERPEFAQFWYLAYHALFWLDLYLTGAEEGFAPPAPFELIEMAEDDLPERAYSKEELQAYLYHGRQRCQEIIAALTDETAQRRCRFAWGEVSFAELLLYNLRHVQEIAAQLSIFLGQNGVSVPDFVPTLGNHTV